jgi:hypothetical protein
MTSDSGPVVPGARPPLCDICRREVARVLAHYEMPPGDIWYAVCEACLASYRHLGRRPSGTQPL